MKTSVKLFIGILAISLVGFASCKKKKDDSPKARLTGKWKVVQGGYDVNNNSVMEATEVMTIPDTFAVFMTFEGDGKGSMSLDFGGATISNGFTWSLINNDQDISIKGTSTSSLLPIDEGTAHINSLTSSDLILRDTELSDSTLASWTVLKKQ